jgi:uncharacterized membrane protein YphA (DoxX/SURF4 family)
MSSSWTLRASNLPAGDGFSTAGKRTTLETFDRRRSTLSPPKRYYPGFFAALFLILLRTAIGWHFFYEAREKVKAPDEKPFTAEPYLRAAVGPLAPRFRGIIPDVDNRALLARDSGGRPAGLRATWRRDLDRIERHYRLKPGQRQAAEQALKNAEKTADLWFLELGNAQAVKQYEDELARVERIERDPESLEYQRKLAFQDRTEVEKKRRELVATFDAWTSALHDVWMTIPTLDQRRGHGPLPRRWTELDWVNLTTRYGMYLVGLGLILGLFTRLSALGAAGFLALFYLSQPPWPGLPEGPKLEGHYLYVNKNLIELLACLVLANMRTGLWLGLDALLFGRFARRRDARYFARWRDAEAEAAARERPDVADPYSDPEELRRRGVVLRKERR